MHLHLRQEDVGLVVLGYLKSINAIKAMRALEEESGVRGD